MFKMSAVSAAFLTQGVALGRRGHHRPPHLRRVGGVGWQRPDARHPAVRGDPPRPESVPAGDPPYTFVTEGVEPAVQQATLVAEGKDVFLQGASIVQQCLRAGLMDELVISLVPVVLGRGVRLLDGLEPGSVALDLVGSSTPQGSRISTIES